MVYIASEKAVSVLGVTHEEFGEQTFAFIQLKKNNKEIEEALSLCAKGNICKYKVPNRVIVLDVIPKLDNGKLMKSFLEGSKNYNFCQDSNSVNCADTDCNKKDN